MAESQIAVLIDAENVSLEFAQELFDQLSNIGRVSVRRAYGDWSKRAGERDRLFELGIEPVHVFRSAASGKNASDIRLAVDAIDLLHQAPVDVFAIVSGDSDFVPIANRLRAGGKTVIGAGLRQTAPATLIRACDRYLFLGEVAKEKTNDPIQNTTNTDALLVRAFSVAMNDHGVVLGGKLRDTLVRLDPGFDYRSLGFPTFVRFLEASPSVQVDRSRGPGDVTVTLVGTEPQIKTHADTPDWEEAVDKAWSQRATESGGVIAGSNAAADGASALGAVKLSASPFKTLQKLLDASPRLNATWRRNKNSIVRL